MTATREATLEIERVVAGGDGLARSESLVVFVPRTLATERVKARITVKGRLARGELLSVERASPSRVDAQCVHYDADQCGGCQIQHASYEEQLRIKSGIVIEAMRRIAHRDVAAPVVRPAADPWHYRRKLTLTMRRNADGWYAGLRRHGDPDAVFPLRECKITDDRVLGVWREVLATSACLPDATELRGAVQLSGDGHASFALEGGDTWPSASRFFAAAPSIRSLWWTPDQGSRRRVETRGTDAAPDASFVQVNAAMAASLQEFIVTRVRAHAPAHVIDAYAGTGDGASVLASAGVRVTAIELDRDAAQWASRRISAPSRVVAQRVEDALPSALPADVVILNPPRTGVDARVTETLAAVTPSPRALVYVSCDPATLARDVSRLPHWRIASLACFDMFPQTAHVETVCELVPGAG
jgi:23S rRNA (uracil1939-C5)-methyltransferase